MSRVPRLCPIFRAQPSACPPEAQNRTLRRRAGALRERQAQKKDTCGQFRTESKAASGEAGESQGVVRAPWQTQLPAVRAVWGFHAGVVERAKIAPLGSEAQIVPPFQGKQRGHAQNWREISMANKKIKFPLWLTPETSCRRSSAKRLKRSSVCSVTALANYCSNRLLSKIFAIISLRQIRILVRQHTRKCAA